MYFLMALLQALLQVLSLESGVILNNFSSTLEVSKHRYCHLLCFLIT